MGKRQKVWARRSRDRLRADLGGRCAWCGGVEDLQFDCIIPQGHWHHKTEWSWRMSFYRGQLLLGNLQLLCEECHHAKTQIDNSAQDVE